MVTILPGACLQILFATIVCFLVIISSGLALFFGIWLACIQVYPCVEGTHICPSSPEISPVDLNDRPRKDEGGYNKADILHGAGIHGCSSLSYAGLCSSS